MANLFNLSNITNSATALSNLILVSPETDLGYKPQNQLGQVYNRPAILFHYQGEQTAELECDITDHYIEDNTAVQDQIAIKPITITTQGFVGELNDVPVGLLKYLKFAAAKLLPLTAYTPELTQTALIAYSEAQYLYAVGKNTVDAGVAAWGSIRSIVGGNSVNAITDANGVTVQTQTLQQQYFSQFYGYQQNRTLFTVQTPWAIFQNMAIKSLKAVQDAETRVITDFEVTFKQIRFAKTLVTQTQFSSENMDGRASTQGSPVTNLGVNTGTGQPTNYRESIGAVKVEGLL